MFLKIIYPQNLWITLCTERLISCEICFSRICFRTYQRVSKKSTSFETCGQEIQKNF